MWLREKAALWCAQGMPAVLIEVKHVRGSVPREAGTRMLVSATQTVGSVGGGHLELQAIRTARHMLLEPANSAPQVLEYPLGPTLGQCCGGVVTLCFGVLTPELLAQWPQSLPRFFLQLYGAGHVGRAIARLLATLDVQVSWIDEREDEFPSALGEGQVWPSHIYKIAVDGVEAEVALAPPGAFYLVLTHRHDLDLRITEAILRRDDFAFLGLIGSRTKRMQFVHRLAARGISLAQIERMTCPIGVAGVVGKEPEVIAVAVVAQLLQLQHASTAVR